MCRRDFFYTYNKWYCAITVAVPRKKAVSVRLKGLVFTVILATYARMAGGYDFQPVAKGTNICGVTPPTNAMWDFVTKKLYYPAGTGEMGYGVDP